LVCLANVVARLWMWSARYGHSAAYETFLGAAPLNEAPYLAAYEEHELAGTAISFLKEAGDKVHPVVNLFLSEYLKYLLHRGRYYFCEELPESAIADEPKEGKLRRDLFIPL